MLAVINNGIVVYDTSANAWIYHSFYEGTLSTASFDLYSENLSGQKIILSSFGAAATNFGT